MGALLLVGVPIWIAWEIHTSEQPVDAAAVFGGYLAPVAIALPLLLGLINWWWKPATPASRACTAEQVATATEQLAENVLATWQQEARNRRISIPAPAKVRWRWGSPQVTPPVAELIDTPVAGIGPRPLSTQDTDCPGTVLDHGVVTQLHDKLYSKLRQGRLVLIGEPGAGKTGAMILLLLAALAHRSQLSKADAANTPVPVWLTLGGWDPFKQSLHSWVKSTIYRDHPYLRFLSYGQNLVDELLRTGRVALFLDGLDEMASHAQAKALARIDCEGMHLRIVLSSRPEEYADALVKERLQNAAVIEIQPVDVATARAYLMHDQIGLQRARWAQVSSYLEANPFSVSAQALNNPLTLSLARDTYHNHDPAELIDPIRFDTVSTLRAHLVERSLVIAYPDECRRTYAIRWLAWIAHHMGTNRDLGWWEIPTWIPRQQARLGVMIAAGITGVILGVVSMSLVVLVSSDKASLIGTITAVLVSGLIGGFLAGLMLGLILLIFFGRLIDFLAKGVRAAVRPRWLHPWEVLKLVIPGFALGLIVGASVGFYKGFTSGFYYGAEQWCNFTRSYLWKTPTRTLASLT